MDNTFHHIPVLLNECLDGLNIKKDGNYFDGTVGGAGHSSEIAKRLDGGRLYCFDKDPDAVTVASERLTKFGCATVVHSDYKDIAKRLPDVKFDGALIDLGVSSFQLDEASRGFSYSKEAPLDMRMSRDGTTAADLVNTLDQNALEHILYEYGEESNARLIARKICSEREKYSIDTTTQLFDVIVSALPSAVRRKEKNPARKTFMALRIAVNNEFDVLREGIDAIFSSLVSGGRFCVISFHSLEDRIVKQKFNELLNPCTCPPDFPVCVCGRKPYIKLINKKPITASEEELESNPRSRSAKLRIIEKL